MAPPTSTNVNNRSAKHRVPSATGGHFDLLGLLSTESRPHPASTEPLVKDGLAGIVARIREFIEHPELRLRLDKLFEHQRRVFGLTHERMARYCQRCLTEPFRGWIKFPTGTGKTAIFVALVAACQPIEASPESKRIKRLVLVPNKDLVKQTHGTGGRKRRGKQTPEFEAVNDVKKGFAKFAPYLKVSKFYGDEKDLSGDVVVCTYQSLGTMIAQAEREGVEFDLVIADEGHRALSDLRQELLNQIPGAKAYVAFSATPEFDKVKNLREAFGGEEPICTMTLKEAVLATLNCAVTCLRIRCEDDLSTVDLNSKGEFKEESLLANVDLKKRDEEVIKIMQTTERGKRAVAFCMGVQHGYELAEKLNMAGVRAACIEGETPVAERERIFEDYRKGIIQVICTDKLLVEGWDEPLAEVAFMIRPTNSKVDAEQRLGRMLRLLFDEDGNLLYKEARIYEFQGKGRSGYTAGHILGAAKLRPDHPLFNERPEDEAEELAEEEDCGEDSGGGERNIGRGSERIISDPEEIIRLDNETRPIERLEVRVDREQIARVLEKSLYLPAAQILDETFTLTEGRADIRATGKEIFHELGCSNPKYRDFVLDEDSLAGLADWAFEGRAARAYSEIRKEVHAAQRLFTDPIDESGGPGLGAALRAAVFGPLTERLTSGPPERRVLPTMPEFGCMTFTARTPEGLVKISGRTLLGVLGVRAAEDYVQFLRGLRLTPIPSPEGQRIENASRVVSLISPLEARLVAMTVTPANVREFLQNVSSFEDARRLMEGMAEASGGVYAPQSVSKLAFVAGVRQKLWEEHPALANQIRIAGALDTSTVTALATFAHGECGLSVAQQLKTKMVARAFEQRRAFVSANLLIPDELDLQLREIPNLELLNLAEFEQIRISLAGGQKLEGQTIVNFFQQAEKLDHDEAIMSRIASRAFGEERLSQRRRDALEEVERQFKGMDLAAIGFKNFLDSSFTLADGRRISGKGYLALKGLSSDETGFAGVVGLGSSQAGVKAKTPFFEDPERLKKLYQIAAKRSPEDPLLADVSSDVPPGVISEDGPVTMAKVVEKWGEHRGLNGSQKAKAKGQFMTLLSTVKR